MNKYPIGLLLYAFFLVACQSQKVMVLKDRLPKDISVMLERRAMEKEAQRKRDREAMQQIHQELQIQILSVPCTEASDWRISVFGSKSCGGPAAFIAYPVQLEDEVLLKISDYNRRSSAYNLKYGIVDDCEVEPAPSSVECREQRPIFVYESKR